MKLLDYPSGGSPCGKLLVWIAADGQRGGAKKPCLQPGNGSRFRFVQEGSQTPILRQRRPTEEVLKRRVSETEG